MATYYVGPGGSDANNGTSYALRKLTLNGVEDLPVAAGDLVHVAPGVFRELLTIDISGTAGNAIEYRADTSGALTDGIGGLVRITGSDNDTTATRANCITATGRNYRTFTGFAFDICTGHLITLLTACSNWIVQDCYFAGTAAASNAINLQGTGTTNTIRRCDIVGSKNMGFAFTHSSTISNSANLIENCRIISCVGSGVRITRIGGITVKGCTFIGSSTCIRVDTALAAGQTTTVNNNIFAWAVTQGLQAVTVPGNEEITENYNTFYGNNSDRSNVTAGANSNAFPPLFNPQLLLSGFALPQLPMFGLSEWSPIRAIAGTSMSSEDYNGIVRPATDSKKSWGAMQFVDVSRETGTVHTGSVALKVADAGGHQIPAPVGNASMTISVYVRWEADYAGTKPQLIIKQAGQSDITVTATGSSGTWELLTSTFTPAASPDFVQVELRSSNTATAGNYDVFWDQLEATVPPGSFESWISNRIPFGVVSPAAAAAGLPVFGGALVR